MSNLELYENKIKRKIEAGELVLGAGSIIHHPIIMEILAWAGFDLVYLDTEHTTSDSGDLVDCIRACDVVGIVPFIRVGGPDKILINKALDAGALGVMVPHVESKEDAELAVKSARYPPEGERGIGATRRFRYEVGGYKEGFPFAVKKTNEEVMINILPIETKRGVENIEETLSVKGIDLVSLSRVEVAHALGYTDVDHPEVIKFRDKVLSMCKQRKINVYASPFDIADMKMWYDKGVRVFISGQQKDYILLHKSAKAFVDQARAIDRK